MAQIRMEVCVATGKAGFTPAVWVDTSQRLPDGTLRKGAGGAPGRPARAARAGRGLGSAARNAMGAAGGWGAWLRPGGASWHKFVWRSASTLERPDSLRPYGLIPPNDSQTALCGRGLGGK